jgi:hypothetical protein
MPPLHVLVKAVPVGARLQCHRHLAGQPGPAVDGCTPAAPRRRFIIDTLAVYVLRDGCELEQLVMAREQHNPEYAFLFDLASLEHAYYRWADGMGWDGMGWDGMGWDGMGWGALRCTLLCCDMAVLCSAACRLRGTACPMCSAWARVSFAGVLYRRAAAPFCSPCPAAAAAAAAAAGPASLGQSEATSQHALCPMP